MHQIMEPQGHFNRIVCAEFEGSLVVGSKAMLNVLRGMIGAV
jgi:hypothetical protein